MDNSADFEEGQDCTIWVCSKVMPVLSAGKDKAEAEVNFSQAIVPISGNRLTC
jgi:hypothetical protein